MIQWVLLAVAGVGAGAINAAVGSGTLLTYPALLAAGLPPVTANATNCVGLAPGSGAAAWMYRTRLGGRRRQLTLLAIATALGGSVGAALVLILPARVFVSLVPWLIVFACALVVLNPILVRIVGKRAARPTAEERDLAPLPSLGAASDGMFEAQVAQDAALEGPPARLGEAPMSPAAVPVLGVVGVYCGYFGAGQGVASMAALTTLYDPDVQHSNAAKNLLAAFANAAAGVVFIMSGSVEWIPAIIVAASSIVGGLAGGGLARRLPQPALRALVICVGLYAAIRIGLS